MADIPTGAALTAVDRNRLLKEAGLWEAYNRERKRLQGEKGGTLAAQNIVAFDLIRPVLLRRQADEEQEVRKLGAKASLEGPEFREYIQSLPDGEDRLGAVEFAVRNLENANLREFPSKLAYSVWRLMRKLPPERQAELFSKTLPSKSVIERQETRRDDGSATLETIRRLQRFAEDTALRDGAQGLGEEP